MCPDRQILSVYFDGELPSPWKEKMEAHLADCPGCRVRLEDYRRLSLVIENEPVEMPVAAVLEKASRDRVWRNLKAGQRRQSPVYPGLSQGRPRFWRGSVTLPFPAVAAAAAILAAALGFAWFGRGNSGITKSQEPMANAGIDLDMPGILPVSDMDGVLQYLSREDTGDIVILRLPESKHFMSTGEPAVIRAADYSRRRQNP